MPLNELQASDLITKKEIADLANVERSTVTSWEGRYPDFPRPSTKVGGSNMYRTADVVEWLRTRGETPIRNNIIIEITVGSPAWEALREAITSDTTYTVEMQHRYLGLALRINKKEWSDTLPSVTVH